MIHGVIGKLLDLDTICEQRGRAKDGYTKTWADVTCPGCRAAIDEGYDFVTATG